MAEPEDVSHSTELTDQVTEADAALTADHGADGAVLDSASAPTHAHADRPPALSKVFEEMSQAKALLASGAVLRDQVSLLGFVPPARPASAVPAGRVGSSTGLRVAAKTGPTTFPPDEDTLFAVLHFLICRSIPAAVEDFRGVFPVIDAHSKRDFRTKAFAHIQQLVEQNVLPSDLGRSSLLNGVSAPRLNEMLLHLSTHVVRRELQLVHGIPQQPSATAGVLAPPRPTLAREIAGMQAQLAYEAEAFRVRTTRLLQVQHSWQCAAERLRRDYAQAIAEQDRVTSARVALEATTEPAVLGMSGATWRTGAVPTIRAAQAAAHAYATSDEFAHTRQLLDQFLNRQEQPPLIDGAKIKSALLSTTGKDAAVISAISDAASAILVRSAQQGNVVDLEALVRQWCAVVKAVLQPTSRQQDASLGLLQDWVRSMQQTAAGLTARVAQAKELRQQLEVALAQVQESVADLEAEARAGASVSVVGATPMIRRRLVAETPMAAYAPTDLQEQPHNGSKLAMTAIKVDPRTARGPRIPTSIPEHGIEDEDGSEGASPQPARQLMFSRTGATQQITRNTEHSMLSSAKAPMPTALPPQGGFVAARPASALHRVGLGVRAVDKTHAVTVSPGVPSAAVRPPTAHSISRYAPAQ